jgi:hypothetical protein
MDWLVKIVVALLEKYLLPLLKALWGFVCRFVIRPVWKLAFPLKDLRTGIKQSRMRYYRVQFSYRSGEKHDAYQEADSNGNVNGYYDNEGKRYIPDEPYECSPLDGGKFQFPKWARIDWFDVFNGNKNSGCWGISEK